VSLWLRAGPFRVSSRGRVGVRLGPVSWYGGGRRRRRKSSSGGWVVVGVLIVIGLAIKYWYIAIPLAVGVVWVIALSRKRAAARHQAWLAGPPPPLSFPGRFTQNWFNANGPSLHPGHIPTLLSELRRRGWSDLDIHERAAPYLPALVEGDD
jgi:hypothetical protein